MPGSPSPSRDDAIATLSARPAWALALLDAVAAKAVARRDLNATIARQLLALGDPAGQEPPRGRLGLRPPDLDRRRPR